MVPFHVFAATHPRFTCPLPSTCVCRQPRLPAPTGSGPRPCRGASRDLRFLLVRVDSRLSIFNRVSFFFPQVILAERSTNLFRIRTSMTPLSQLLYNPHLQAPLGSARNKGLITPLESALTKNSPASRLESALTKTPGEGLLSLTRQPTNGVRSRRFALKANQQITHIQRLRACESTLKRFLEVASVLNDGDHPRLRRSQSVRRDQRRGGPRNVHYKGEVLVAHSAGQHFPLLVGVGRVPGFAIDRPNCFQLLLRQRFVHRREFLGNERVEFRGNVLQFFLQRIDARDLIIGRPPFVIQNVSVELRGFLANALFSGDRAAFLRGHDLLAHFFCLLRQFLQPLAEECVSFRSEEHTSELQ